MRLRLRQDPRIYPALEALRQDFLGSRGAQETINNMILYATIGRDRRKLDLSYVEQTRESCEQVARMEKSFLTQRKEAT